MKENVIDILMYILQNASSEDEAFQQDHDALKSMLLDAGFASSQIHEAFRWLDDLGTQITEQAPVEPASRSIRHFSAIEKSILDPECQNYMLSLTNAGILSSNSFELVVDRLIALDAGSVDLDQLEWIVLIVLSNQSHEQAAFERLETMRFQETNHLLN